MRCSDLVRKLNNDQSKDDIGYSCTVKITDETMMKTQNGDVLTFDELAVNTIISVYFEESVTAGTDSEKLIFQAKEITVFDNQQ